MEILPGGLTMTVPEGCFPLSTDSMVLAHFAAGCGKHILDLGSGCGTLGLLLCAGNPALRVTGIEIDARAHEAAEENIRRNRLEDRLASIHGDLREISARFTPGSFDACVSNPPYFSGGPASALPGARREDTCGPADLLRAASRVLKYGGCLYLVHRPERLAQLIALGAAENLQAKTLVLLRHREGGAISLILLKMKKGGKPGLDILDRALHNTDGSETAFFREIYHIREE